MTTHTNESDCRLENVLELVHWPDHSVNMDKITSVFPADQLVNILFEQLEYLLQYSDEERDRLNRVTAILLESFQ